MIFFQKNHTLENTIIIGCSRLGANLADAASEEGRNILIIDKDKDSFRKLSPAFGGLTVVGDGMDFDTLKEGKIEQAQVVVVVTNNDNANVMISQIAKDVFHVPRVIARLYDPARECIYRELEISTICPAELSAMQVDHILESMSEKTDVLPQANVQAEDLL